MPSLKQSIGNNQHISLDDVCFLISTTIIYDDLMQPIETVELAELVYCSPLNIGQKEFGVTMANGLKAEKVFVIDYDEYDGESKLEYNRVKYNIYRTFVRNDGYIELYCEVRVGGN